MAARHHTRLSNPAVHQTAQHAAQGHSPLYHDSEPRTIWFPRQFLAQVEREPGGLIALLTIALSAATKGGGQ
jgi:hypothetical protein